MICLFCAEEQHVECDGFAYTDEGVLFECRCDCHPSVDEIEGEPD